MPPPRSSIRLTIRVKKAFAAEVSARAARDKISVSELIRLLLAQYMNFAIDLAKIVHDPTIEELERELEGRIAEEGAERGVTRHNIGLTPKRKSLHTLQDNPRCNSAPDADYQGMSY